MQAEHDKAEKKEQSRLNKIRRDERRMKAEQELPFEDYKALQKQLSKESQQESIQLKQMNYYWKETIAQARQKVADFEANIQRLKDERKAKSAALQQKLFQQYAFLNAQGETKSLGAIFDNNPPASAGECAARNCCTMPFNTNCNRLPWLNFGGDNRQSLKYGNTAIFIPRVRANANPFWLTC
ncbi:hypothetical protein [Flavobacterium piscinae]|uniref:hypothetical protein n=1 Tax=Flavobacterium piscinae TaxID=2506424 RepID=UPI003709BAF4